MSEPPRPLVHAERLACKPGTLTVVVEPERRTFEEQLGRSVERIWAEKCARNPRLHDGPLLRVIDVDRDNGRIRCARSSYKPFAVQPDVDTDTRMLGVSGVLLDAERGEVLLGKRSESTMHHPGKWEFAPAGGVESGSGAPAVMTETAIVDALRQEGAEELGIDLETAGASVIGLLWDDGPPSLDIVVLVPTRRSGDDLHAASWEYTGVQWVSVDELRTGAALDVSEPARAMVTLIPNT